MRESVTQRVIALLDEERAALRTADFAMLDSLGKTKETLFAALQTSKPGKAELIKIKRRLDNNQALLAAAIKGVADAQNRLTAMQNAREKLSVYDQTGQIASVPTGRRGFEKKA